MKKAILSLLLLLALLVSAVPVSASDVEAEPVETTEDVSGEGDGAACGEAMSWFVEGTTLTISGSGEMYDFEDGKAPWQDYKDSLTKVIFEGGILQIGTNSFRDFDRLKAVEFGPDLIRIGAYAFYDCDGLTSLSLPKTFKKFGQHCLSECDSLTEIHCDGVFPRFDDGCLWNTQCTIYYPADNPWSVILIEQLETAFHGRIHFLASDGTDHYEPTEAAPSEVTAEPVTTAPTETTAETAPTVETLPETVPEITASPETTEETKAETTQETEETFRMETAPAETTAPRITPKGSTIGLALVAGTLAFLAIGALLFRAFNRRD